MSKEARVFWNVLFVGAAVGTGLYLSRGPWQMYRVQHAKAEQAQAQMRNAEKEREELTKESTYSDSPAGREQIARDHGYIREGEKKIEAGN